MGAKVHCDNYFPVLFPNKNAEQDARINRSLIEAWPDCAEEAILKENQFYSTFKQGTMAQCSEKDIEILKLTMLKHEEIFRDQVRELHRLYRMQKLLMAELKRKDSNTSTLTCGPGQDGPFPIHVVSEPLKTEGKNNFWGALSSPMTNKDSRDCRQTISSLDYMQNFRPSLYEQNLKMGLSPQEGEKSPLDFYYLQPSRARKRTFDLEQPADEYMDDEVSNNNGEEKTSRSSVKDIIIEPSLLNGQSIAELESEVQLTLKTGCEKGARKNDRQNGASIQLSIPEISNVEVKEHKQLRYPEEALLFPANTTRSEALSQETVGKQRPVISHQSFSRGPFNFDQEYKKNTEWPAISGTMLFQDQRESRYSWPKEGVFPGTVPQQKNAVFALVSSKGLAIDSSSTSMTGSLLGVSPRVITNSHRELRPPGLWRKAEDSLCHFPRGVQSQEFCIPLAETDLQMQNFDLQDKYPAQPFVTSGSNAMNVKRKASEYGMGTWYQNGNLVQHMGQDSQSIYCAGSPSIFGQALCQTGPIAGSKTSQQQGILALSASAPSSSVFPSNSLQECSRSLWPTTFIGLSPQRGLEGQSDVDSKLEKEVDLTLGLSSGVTQESRKDTNTSKMKTEVSYSNNNGKFEITNKNKHLHGDVQRGHCLTRTFIESPYVKEKESSCVKHDSHDNGLDFSELVNSSPESVWHRTGDSMVSTKNLADNLGERGVSASKEKISLASDLLKVHDIRNGEKCVKSDATQTAEGGKLKSENILGLVDKTMNGSTAPWEIIGNNQEPRMGRVHADRHLCTATDPAKQEMKIETFKENINAVYGPRKEEDLGVGNSKQLFVAENKILPPADEQVGRASASQTLISLAEEVSTKGDLNDGETPAKFSQWIAVSSISHGVESTREVSFKTKNALHFDEENENGSEDALCCSEEPFVLTKDESKRDAHAKEADCAKLLSGTYKANVQLSQHDTDLEKCSQHTDLQRSSGSNYEPEVDTFQMNTTEDPYCSSPIVESERIGSSASRDSSVNTDAVDALLKIASEKSSDRLDLDSCKFHLASGVKGSLDWFADAVVLNADILESASTVREEADNPLSSTRSGGKAKQSEASDDSIPKENDYSPHASNGLDFFESMTLMLEESNVDVDCNLFAKQEKEAERPSSPVNPILRPSKRGKRRRDFQREILPSISSLSRQEITEDMQIIGGLIRSTGDAWHTGSTRRSSGKFSMRDDWLVPLTGRRSRYTSGFQANGGNMKRNVDFRTAKQCDQEVERLTTLSWTRSWGDTIRRRRMQRPRVSMPSLALNPV